MVGVPGAVRKSVSMKVHQSHILYWNDQYKWEIKLNFIRRFSNLL